LDSSIADSSVSPTVNSKFLADSSRDASTATVGIRPVFDIPAEVCERPSNDQETGVVGRKISPMAAMAVHARHNIMASTFTISNYFPWTLIR
jgi:hypothetical protein